MSSIGLWGWRPIQPEETAQGLLLRIAEIQGHRSIDRTARAAGISRSKLAHGVAAEIERFADEVCQNFEQIAADSPVRDKQGRLCLRGHPVGDLLDFGPRRVCPACLDESWHHRFWWDIGPITTCPRHRIELVGACRCGHRFGWRDGGLIRCSACGNSELRRLPRKQADTKALRADAYLISRFSAEKAESVPILDAMSVRDVFETLERIGAAALGGYSYAWQSAESLTQPLSAAQARGFEVLADSKLDEVLTLIYDGFIAQGGNPEEGFTACYGWLYHWFNHKRGPQFSPLLAEIFLIHGAARFPIAPKARLGKLPEGARRKLSLKAAATAANTSVFAMKSIGLALGIIRTEKKSGSQISFPIEEVERIARDLKGALSFDETKKRLGVGSNTLFELMRDRSIEPALLGGTEQRRIYVFRPRDLDDLLLRLSVGSTTVVKPQSGLIAITSLGRGKAATIAECVKNILSGRIEVRARTKEKSGLQSLFVDHDDVMEVMAGPTAGPDLPFAAATRKMRLNARGLRKAIDGGFIDGVLPGSMIVPAKAANAFAKRFMMMGEFRERLGGHYGNLRVQLQMAGFDPYPDLEKCLCAGYLRKKIEPFIRQIEAGEVSLGRPDGSWKSLVGEAEKILKAAKAPLSSEDLLARLRRTMTIGPSDQSDFFYAAMWDSRESIVYIEGAGWWLRIRPYQGRTFPLNGPVPSQTNIVDDIIIEMLRATNHPLSQEEIIVRLEKQSIRRPIKDGEVFLRRFFVRHTDKLIKLTGLGYWDRVRPYPPALYDPRTWKEKTQTAAQRVGLWIIKLLNETGRPLARTELEIMLQDHEIIPRKCSRAYISNAAAEFVDEIIYLNQIGYWLARKPWPPAGYRPIFRKHAV